MTRTVWKISLGESLVHELPIGAEPLHTDYQNGAICVWYLVDPNARKIKRAIIVAGTGWSMPDFIRKDMHVGSALNRSNWNIWHVFDLGYLDNLKPYDQNTVQLLEDESRRHMEDDADGS